MVRKSPANGLVKMNVIENLKKQKKRTFDIYYIHSTSKKAKRKRWQIYRSFYSLNELGEHMQMLENFPKNHPRKKELENTIYRISKMTTHLKEYEINKEVMLLRQKYEF
jgi:hypothetical protein